MKIGEFCVVIITMIIFLEFMGIPTGLDMITDSYGFIMGDGQLTSADMESSSFFNDIFGLTGALIVLAGAGAVIVGFFAKGYDVSLVILPIIIATATLFAGTFWTITSHVQELEQVWATNLVTIIMGGIGVAFIWSCVDYFAGR